jgi:AcrR family transcriptional regulator
VARTRKIEILEVARDLFAQRGFEKTTMADIAEVVGVVESALYRHFRSKQELLVEAVRTFYEPIIEDVERAAASIVDPLARLRYAVWRHLRAYAEEPELCRLVVHEARGLEDYWNSEIAKLNRRYTAFVTRAVADGVASGAFAPDVRPALVRDMVYGTLEHVGLAAISRGATLDVDGLTAELMAVLEPGLTRRDQVADQLHAEVERLARVVDLFER